MTDQSKWRRWSKTNGCAVRPKSVERQHLEHHAVQRNDVYQKLAKYNLDQTDVYESAERKMERDLA